MEKRWNILKADPEKTAHLQSLLQINTLACNLLALRGLETFEQCKKFFRPQLSDLHSPWLMKDMEKAVNRIMLAFANREKILVFGDYDVDGTTSVALMYRFLCSIYNAGLLDFYIPHRYHEGYGVSKRGIEYAKEHGFSLVISLDCGIKSYDLIAYARTLDIDLSYAITICPIACCRRLQLSLTPSRKAVATPTKICAAAV